MICILALIVFGILGIFSVGYRKIAKEAFDCVFRRITLRKCTTGLDKRLKSQITGKLMKKTPRTAKFVYKNFEVLSWVFTILLIASLAYSAYGAYNYVMFGNCNGENSNGFCVYDSLFGKDSQDAPICSVPVDVSGQKYSRPSLEGMDFFGNPDANLIIVEVGCYACDYSRQAQPVVEKIVAEYADKIKFYYINFPMQTHKYSHELAIAAECAREQNAFWQYYPRLFRINQDETPTQVYVVAEQLNLDMESFRDCFENEKTAGAVDSHLSLAVNSGIYGTPTFFIGDYAHVGPLSYDEFKKIVEEQLS